MRGRAWGVPALLGGQAKLGINLSGLWAGGPLRTLVKGHVVWQRASDSRLAGLGRRPRAYLVRCLVDLAFGSALLPASPSVIKAAVSFKSCVVYLLLY